MNFLMVREVLKKHSRLDLQLCGHGTAIVNIKVIHWLSKTDPLALV